MIHIGHVYCDFPTMPDLQRILGDEELHVKSFMRSPQDDVLRGKFKEGGINPSGCFAAGMRVGNGFVIKWPLVDEKGKDTYTRPIVIEPNSKGVKVSYWSKTYHDLIKELLNQLRKILSKYEGDSLGGVVNKIRPTVVSYGIPEGTL